MHEVWRATHCGGRTRVSWAAPRPLDCKACAPQAVQWFRRLVVLPFPSMEEDSPWSPEDLEAHGPRKPKSKRQRQASRGLASGDLDPWAAEDGEHIKSKRQRQATRGLASGDLDPWAAEDGAQAANCAAASSSRQVSLSTSLVLPTRSPAAPTTSYAQHGMDPGKVKERLMHVPQCRCASAKGGHPCHSKVPLHALQKTCCAYWQLSDEERAHMAGHSAFSGRELLRHSRVP